MSESNLADGFNSLRAHSGLCEKLKELRGQISPLLNAFLAVIGDATKKHRHRVTRRRYQEEVDQSTLGPVMALCLPARLSATLVCLW